MTELLLLVGVGVLVLANGFFVAASSRSCARATPSSSRWRTRALKGARLAGLQLERIDEYLSACQLGITMASLGIGFMGEPAIASLLEAALGDALPHGVTLAISLGLRLLRHHRAAHHDRRAGAEDLRDHPRRGHGAPRRRACSRPSASPSSR